MSDPPSDLLERWLAQLLEGTRPRQDRDQPTLATPQQPQPLLIQSPASFVALALGLELLAPLARHGGAALSPEVVHTLRDQLRERFGAVEHAHLEEESRRTWLWLEAALLQSRTDDAPPPLRYDPAPRLTLTREALTSERDLLLSWLDDAHMRFRRMRVRPERVQPAASPDDAPLLIARRVPDGAWFELPLDTLRWVMLVERIQSVATPAPLAEVLPFSPRDPDD